MKSRMVLPGIFLVCIVFASKTCAQTPTPSPNFDCPNDDQDGGVYPNPEDCTKYFDCANGFAWELECPPGLVFDPAVEGCDYPNGVNCPNYSE